MKERKIDVVVAGHLCLDIIPEFPRRAKFKIETLFVPGKLIKVEEATISTGGAVSNVGLALHRLGMKVEFMGKVGDDFWGRAIIERLKETIPLKGMSIARGKSSSYTLVISPPGIDRMFLHDSATNDTFGYDDIDFDLVSQTRLFHLGYPTLMRRLYEKEGAELSRIYKQVKSRGTITSLDVSLPDPGSPAGKVNWRAILKKTLPYVDIFLPNVEEAIFFLEKEKFLRQRDEGIPAQFEGSDLSSLSDEFLRYGAKVVGIKCGSRGFYMRTAEKDKLWPLGAIHLDISENWAGRELWQPTYYVAQVASAVGAGDSTVAGFLSAYLRGEKIESALEYACALGAQNVQALDATGGIGSWEEIGERIKSGWTKNKLEIKTEGWTFDSRSQVWIGPNNKQRHRLLQLNI